MANEIDIFLAIAGLVSLIMAVILIGLFGSYKKYKKEKKIDIVTIGSIIIAVVVTVILAPTIFWPILTNTLNILDPSDIEGAERAVIGFLAINFIVLGITFVLSYVIIEKIYQKLSKEKDVVV
ncbi:MAG: hypothetical protein ACFFCZ_22990 [Promethearchaeota archaeon]